MSLQYTIIYVTTCHRHLYEYSKFYRSKWIVTNGVDTLLVLLAVEDDYPVFGELEDIFVTRTSQAVFRVGLYQTTLFNRHHAYIVNPTNSQKNALISELYHPFTHCVKELTSTTNSIENWQLYLNIIFVELC